MSGLWTVCVEQLFRLLTRCTKKKNLCCEGEWKVCVCLLNKTSTVEQHIFSIEANWFLQNYSLILPVCHKKTGFAYFPFSTAEAKVFLHWPVYNYSVVMRLNLKKKPTPFFGTIFVWVLFVWVFFECTSEALQLCWNQRANPTERLCNIMGFWEKPLLQLCKISFQQS